MKTPQEIEKLKHAWCCDPCWDIEDTEGFEDHKEELKAYREKCEAEWYKRREERIAKEMEEMGITNRKTYRYLQGLERAIERMEERINKLEDH
jgi:hypothetical protein